MLCVLCFLPSFRGIKLKENDPEVKHERAPRLFRIMWELRDDQQLPDCIPFWVELTDIEDNLIEYGEEDSDEDACIMIGGITCCAGVGFTNACFITDSQTVKTHFKGDPHSWFV